MTALQPRDGEDTLQHGVELDGVLLDAVEHLGALIGIGTARQGQRQPDAGDGGTQFVGHAAEQVALALDLIAQLVGHDVEIAHQFGNFVAAVAKILPCTNIEIAARQLMGRIAQALNGLGELMRDHQAKNGGEDGTEFQRPKNIAGNALR